MAKNIPRKVAVHVDDEKVTHVLYVHTVEVNVAVCTMDEAAQELRSRIRSQPGELGFTIGGGGTFSESERHGIREEIERFGILEKRKQKGVIAKLKRFFGVSGHRPPVQP